MGSRRASGWILARFAKVLGGFGEGLWRNFGRIFDFLNTQWADFGNAWHDSALLGLSPATGPLR